MVKLGKICFCFFSLSFLTVYLGGRDFFQGKRFEEFWDCGNKEKK
jgi:hypothetical protein